MVLRIMTVHAHPDDESSKGAATLAHYAAQGAEVTVVTCTGGERGDVLNPLLDTAETRADLPAVRRREMAAAAAVLGVRHRFLGFVDSGLAGDGEPLPEGCFARQEVPAAAERLVAAIREVRPHVVVTYDPSGGYPHPDHVQTHRVAVAAYEAAGDEAAYPGAGPAWRPSKLYYLVAFSRAWFETLHQGMLAEGIPSSMGAVLDSWPDWAPDLAPTTRIACAEHFATRDRAFRAHATQAAPDNPFFSHPRDLERRLWPTEDYVLARSVRPARLPETDFFDGIEE
jgi:mycothiol S-conjugate amidase